MSLFVFDCFFVFVDFVTSPQLVVPGVFLPSYLFFSLHTRFTREEKSHGQLL